MAELEFEKASKENNLEDVDVNGKEEWSSSYRFGESVIFTNVK